MEQGVNRKTMGVSIGSTLYTQKVWEMSHLLNHNMNVCQTIVMSDLSMHIVKRLTACQTTAMSNHRAL